MNILLVDDDQNIIDTIKTMVEWEKIGIMDVYSANSAKQAINIMEQVPMDILLCDIEMHNMSGIELVEWIRKRGDGMEVIFLTSHANFNYAQQAIKLGSFDYLLKPVAFDKLETVLEKSSLRVCEKEKDEKFHQKYAVWEKNIASRKEYFFTKLLMQEGNLEWEAYQKKQQELDLNYGLNQRFIYIRVEICDYITIYNYLESGMSSFTVGNITRTIFNTQNYQMETVIRTDSEDSSQWNLFLSEKKESNKAVNQAELELLCREYIRQIERIQGSKVACYAGSFVCLQDMPVNVSKVKQMSKEMVLEVNNIMFLDAYQLPDVTYQEPEIKKWKPLLEQGDIPRLLYEINLYLNQLMKRKEATAKILKLFILDFDQIVFSVLREHEIPMNQFIDTQAEVKRRTAVKSIESTKEYVQESLIKALDCLKRVEGDESPVDIVKKYIDHNLGEDMNRETFAELVFLNVDYLAKLFKQEIGTSIGTYLLEKRIEKAKILLATTKNPINEIAVLVGYTNFSYFAKLFRKMTTMTPNEYRRFKTDD